MTAPGDSAAGRDALARLPLHRVTSDGYAFLVELLWEAVRARFRVAEVPITFIERWHGASKLNRSVLLESMLLPWRLGAAAVEGGFDRGDSGFGTGHRIVMTAPASGPSDATALRGSLSIAASIRERVLGVLVIAVA